MFSRATLAACVLVCVHASAFAGENWPGWRGPTGNGLSDEKNLPLTWGGKANENVLWQAKLFPSDKIKADQNQSSPIVWGERVFVTLSYWPAGADKKDYPEHHVICFSTKDGERLWDTVVPPGPWRLSDLRGGYTAPTPATDGQRVYAAFGSSVIAAIDFEGKIAWRKEIKPHHFDVAWAASPVVYVSPKNETSVIVVCDQARGRKSSTIYALDGATGETRWEHKRPDVDWAHSTPLLARVKGKLQLLTAAHNGPQGLDPATGDTLWSFRVGQQIGDTVTPTYGDGLLYVDSGRGGPGYCVDATGAGDVSKTALKWKTPSNASAFSSPVLVGDYLYRLQGGDTLVCRNWQTGAEVYKERLTGIDSAVSPVATADGRIYVASAGKSYVVKAGAKFEVLAINQLGDGSRASPALAGGRIYLKGSRYLICVGKQK